MNRLQYAVIDVGGKLATVEPSLEAAVGAAARISPSAGTVVEEVPERFRQNPAEELVPLKGMVKMAVKQTTLRRFSENEVMSLSLQEAHATLAPILTSYHRFNKLGVDRGRMEGNDEVAGMIDNFLGQNYKTGKDNPNQEYPTLVQGLNFIPHFLVQKLKTVEGLPPPLAKAVKSTPKANLCVGSNAECRETCLAFAGQNAMTEAQASKAWRTLAFLQHPEAFLRLLVEAVNKHKKRCAKGIAETETLPSGKSRVIPGGRKIVYHPFVRLNVLSDVPWEEIFPALFEIHRDVQFYDYTKVAGRKPPDNYDLTFSYSGTNDDHAMAEIRDQRRMAVVFILLDGNKEIIHTMGPNRHVAYETPLPSKFWGLDVVDGDISDLRPLDPHPCVVGLRWKMPLTGEQDFDPLESKFVTPCYVTDEGTVVSAVTPRMQPIEETP